MTNAAPDAVTEPVSTGPLDAPPRPAAAEQRVRRPASILLPDQPIAAGLHTHGPVVETLFDAMTSPDLRPPTVFGLYGPSGQSTTSVLRQLQHRIDPPGFGFTSDRAPTHRLVGRTASGRETRVRTRLTRAWVWGQFNRANDLNTPLPYEMRPLDPDHGGAITIWFNPWMYERRDQLWTGLAREIMIAITDRLSGPERERLWFDVNLRRTDYAALRKRLLGSYLPRTLTGLLAGVVLVFVVAIALVSTAVAAMNNPTVFNVIGPTALILLTVLGTIAQLTGGSFRQIRGWVAPNEVEPGGAAVSGTGQARGTDRDHLSPALRDADEVVHLATQHSPLYVFVDDIDRSRPDIVADAIEAINLFLNRSMGRCVFVLGLDPSAVAHRLETAFTQPSHGLSPDGTETSAARHTGWRLMEKMVDLPVRMPRLSDTDLGGYVDRLLDNVGSSAVPPLGDAASGPEPSKPPRQHSGRTGPGTAVELGIVPDSPHREARALAAEDLEEFPVIRAALRSAVVRLPGRDPRQAQVFINLWRFYVVLEHRMGQLDGSSHANEVHAVEIARLVELMVRWPYLLDPLGEPAVDETIGAPLDLLLAACFGDDEEPWGSVARQCRLEPADRAVQGLRQLLRQALPHLDVFTALARRYL